MESGFRSFSSSRKSPSLMAFNPHYGIIHHPAKTLPFPQAPPPAQPPLLPLPVHLQASPQCPSSPASRPVLRAKKPRHAAPSPKKQAPATGASAPIVVAAPFKKRMAAAAAEAEQQVEWTSTDSLYSVSPPPSSVPMPTSLLVAATGRKVPTACAVEVAAGGGTVDVGATHELRRLLRL